VVGDGDIQANNFSHHVTIRNNTASNWGRWGILTGFVDDVLIERNTMSGSVLEHGIYVSNSGDRPIVRYNHIFNNRANGIHLNGDIDTGDTSLPGCGRNDQRRTHRGEHYPWERDRRRLGDQWRWAGEFRHREQPALR
jgi:parallel beta-helix repeat protein